MSLRPWISDVLKKHRLKHWEISETFPWASEHCTITIATKHRKEQKRAEKAYEGSRAGLLRSQFVGIQREHSVDEAYGSTSLGSEIGLGAKGLPVMESLRFTRNARWSIHCTGAFKNTDSPGV